MKSVFLLFSILLLTLSSPSLLGVETDSSLRIMGSLGGGVSMHGGGFKGIPSVQTCCTTYPDAIGSIIDLSLGLRTALSLKQDQFSVQGALLLNMQRFSSPFASREFVGNFISGNTVSPAVIDYSLGMNGIVIGLEPRALFQYSDIPLSLFFGLHAGTFMSTSALQTEQLVEPSNAVFLNGTKSQNNFDGAITNTRSLLLSAHVGLEYTYQLSADFALHPFLSYRSYIQSFIEDHPWTMDAFTMGIGISHSIPKESPPIIVPPPPIEKEPEIVLNMHFHAMMNDGMLEFGDTIPYPYDRIIEITSTTIAPLYLFEEQSGDKVKEQSHNEVTLAQALKNTVTPIRIIAFESDREPRNTALKRAQTVKKRLMVNGADREFDIQTRTVRTQGLRYPELMDEARMVMVSFADGTLPTHVIRDTQYVFRPTSLRFLSEPSITGARIAGLVTLGMAKTMTIEEPDITFSLSPHPAYPLETQKLIAQSYASLDPNIRTKGRIELYARPIFASEQQKESLQSESNTDFILAYSDFDKSDFTWIDQTVINRIVEASKAGRNIILTPLIDDLGTSDHNSPLAEKRMQSALSLLSNVLTNDALNKITTASARTYTADGGSLGRVLHRGIAVTIGK